MGVNSGIRQNGAHNGILMVALDSRLKIYTLSGVSLTGIQDSGLGYSEHAT